MRGHRARVLLGCLLSYTPTIPVLDSPPYHGRNPIYVLQHPCRPSFQHLRTPVQTEAAKVLASRPQDMGFQQAINLGHGHMPKRSKFLYGTYMDPKARNMEPPEGPGICLFL